MVDILPYLYYTTRGIEAWLSLVERCVRDAEAACSNHVASIYLRPDGQAAKTTPSHGVNPGSIPGQVRTKCLRHFNSPSPSFMRGIRGFFLSCFPS